LGFPRVLLAPLRLLQETQPAFCEQNGDLYH